MSTPDEDPRDRLARIHPDACGTRRGYMQISRARTQLRQMGVPESHWPRYDDACRQAHAQYTGRWREAGGFGTPPGPKPGDHPCGTMQRYFQHRNERRKLRKQGVSEAELPPIDQPCRDAWARYEQKRRPRQKAPRKKVGKKARRLRRTVEEARQDPGADPMCGTMAGVRRHRRERRGLAAQGVAPLDLPPICRKCEAELLRQRVLRRIAEARAINQAAS